MSPSVPVHPPTAASPPLPVANRDFLGPEDEARVFWRLRRRAGLTLLRQALATARFRLSLVVFLSALLWMGLFQLLVRGFRFIEETLPPTEHDRLVQTVFGTFFTALLLMLVVSSAILLYGSLFRSPEMALLLTVPARVERVFLYKFQEAMLLTSWGFLLLGSPLLLAYGLVTAAPWYYYAILPPLMLAFLYIPVALGAVICLAVMHWMPQRRTHLLTGVAVLLLAWLAWFGWSLAFAPGEDMFTVGWFQQLLQRLQVTQQRLLPSWWLSSALLEAAQHGWSESLLFLALTISNGLFLRQLAIWTAMRVYRPAYSAFYDRPAPRRRARAAWLDRGLDRALRFLPMPVRLMMIKDLRLFRRDPMQWSQVLIFFGLQGLYFVNVLRSNSTPPLVAWVNIISFLNLAVIGLLLSTFTTRFVFPMISLEARRYWILGLLPMGRDTILWSKFAFAVCGSLIPCSLSVLVSDTLLEVSPVLLASHQLTCLLLCLGLSGIAVGLGARLPNLREQSPARIAAGFGGTLNLVLSTIYIVAIVLLTALPSHFYLAAESARAPKGVGEAVRFQAWLQFWMTTGTISSVTLGLLATIVPLWIGFRAFRRTEF